MAKTQIERKLDLIFETLLHISAKMMSEDEMDDLDLALRELNDEAHRGVDLDSEEEED